MHEDKIAEYRAQAADCKARAELEPNKTTSARWLKVADEWFRMADDLERRLYPNKSLSSNHERNQ
jgi:hypothetical protein